MIQYCRQSQNCSLKPSPYLEKALLSCKLETEAMGCSEIEKKNPQIASRFKKCDGPQFCAQKELEARQTIACLRGYKNALVDLGISIKDMAVSVGDFIDSTWEDFKANNRKRNEFLKQCNLSLSCKKDLVKDDHRYNNLSDAELSKLPATFLYVQAQDMRAYKASLDRARPQPYRPISERPVDDVRISGEQSLKLMDMLKIAKDKAIAMNKEYSCYHEEAQTELGCYILGNVIDPTLVAGYFLKGVRAGKAGYELVKAAESTASAEKTIEAAKTTTQVEEKIAASAGKPSETAGSANRRGSQIGNSAALREQFTQKYLDYNPTTVAQNEEWIRLADSGRSKGRYFLEVENSKMKELNDTLKDKNLVTSLTNYHKELTLNEIKQLEKKYPGLKIDPYSDFKSVRLAISGKVPKNIYEELSAAYARINSEFGKTLAEQGLIRKTEKPETWFRAGFAETADEANLYARYGRGQQGTNNIQSFKDPTVKEALNTRLSDIRNLNDSLRRELAGSSAIDGASFHEDVYDIVRKNPGKPEKIKADLKNRFGLENISDSTIQKLQSYGKAVDEFSPGIRVAKRELATLDDAAFGGLSADVIGLGSMNLKATADALASAKDLSSSIDKARLGERAVTQKFNSQKTAFQEALKKAVDPSALKSVCSGDDCIAVATRPLTALEKSKILTQISEGPYAGRFRMAFVPDGVADKSVRNALATHGESIEKVLRKNLSANMNAEKLRNITFAMDMKTKKLGEGGVGLIVGSKKSQPLTGQEKKQIQKAFEEALKQINTDLKNEKGIGNYTHAPYN